MLLALQIAGGILLALLALAFVGVCIAIEFDDVRTFERGCGCTLFVAVALGAYLLWHFVLAPY